MYNEIQHHLDVVKVRKAAQFEIWYCNLQNKWSVTVYVEFHIFFQLLKV